MNLLLSSKKVTTKKEHQCFGCLRKMPAGSVMFSFACIFEGEFSSGYKCITCEEIIKISLKGMEHDEGFMEGFVRDEVGKNGSPEQFLEQLKNINNVTNSEMS